MSATGDAIDAMPAGGQPPHLAHARLLPEQRAMAIEACRKLARTCLASRRLDEAIRYFRKVIELGATDPESQLALGHALELAGRFEEAGQAFDGAVRADPAHVEALFRLASIHLRQSRNRDAIHFYREALKHDPANVRVINNLANLIINVELAYDEALAMLERALAIEPDNRKLLWTMMLIAQNTGRLNRARRCLERIIELEPNLAKAHRMLSQLTRYRPDHPHLAAMEVSYAATAGDPASRSQMGFALFKAFDDIGDHDRAFFHLEEANRLHRATLDYDARLQRRLIERIRSTFTEGFMALHGKAGHRGFAPVFIVGMPRSGTTLTEQILAGHPEIHAAGELDLIGNFVRALYPRLKSDPDEDLASQIEADHLRQIGRTYHEKLLPLMGEKPVSTDKMPVNLMWLGFIRLALPEARFIHCRRDSLETCFSIYANFFAGTGNPYAFDLAEIGDYHRLSERLMNHWKALFGEAIHTLDHQALLADPETELKALLGFLGLPHHPACLDIGAVDRPVLTISNTQVRTAIGKPGKSRAAPYLRHLTPLIDALRGRFVPENRD